MNLPYKFSPGTKAKAQEVNENFQAVCDEIDRISESTVSNKSSLQALIETQIKNLDNSLRPIGQPIFRLDDTLYDDEIRLEGAEVSQDEYPNLYKIYGNTYGSAASGKFKLPDFRNRAVFGATNFGYISAGLPNVTGQFGAIARGGSTVSTCSGPFTRVDDANWGPELNGTTGFAHVTFSLKNGNSIYGASSTVQPPAIKVRVVTRYE